MQNSPYLPQNNNPEYELNLIQPQANQSPFKLEEPHEKIKFYEDAIRNIQNILSLPEDNIEIDKITKHIQLLLMENKSLLASNIELQNQLSEKKKSVGE